VAGFSLHAGVMAEAYQRDKLERLCRYIAWPQRLKRVFNIDIETCPKCGGAVKVIACIEDPVVIDKILTHLDEKAALAEPVVLPQSRARPQAGLSD